MESEQSSKGTTPASPANTYEASITLQPQSASVRHARHFLADQLRREPAELVEVATLLVSELVTNAVRHAHTETEVGLVRRDDTVRIEVADRSAEPAALADRGVTAPNGRGLRIVDALASDWGVEIRDGGKIVWFELAGERFSDEVASATDSASGTAPHPRQNRPPTLRQWRLVRPLGRSAPGRVGGRLSRV